jgi:hypothetical protein
VEAIPLSGEYTLVPQLTTPDFIINANGIVATPNNSWLLIIHSTLGKLYRVDPQTGYAMEVYLGGELMPIKVEGRVGSKAGQ